MELSYKISLYIMALLYVAAGINHFINPKLYLRITPKWVPVRETVNILVGLTEIGLGMTLLFPATRNYAAIGVILLLFAVFPANVYHFQKSLKKRKYVVATFIRLPIQALLIYWAYTFI